MRMKIEIERAGSIAKNPGSENDGAGFLKKGFS